MTVLPVADARAQLSKLIDQAVTTHERFQITRNGRRSAVLLATDDYDTMLDTILVLSDAHLLAAHTSGLQAIDAGDVLNAEELTDAMRKSGRILE